MVKADLAAAAIAVVLFRGRAPLQDFSALWQKLLIRILGVQAHLDSVPGKADFRLRHGQWKAPGDIQLPGYQVGPGDHFRHAVFNLQPGVHFQKIEIFFCVQQKLDRTRSGIAASLGQRYRSRSHLLTQNGVHRG